MATPISDRLATAWLLFWIAPVGVYVHAGGLAFAGLGILLGAVGWLLLAVHRLSSGAPFVPGAPGTLRSASICTAAFAAFFAWLGLSGAWSGAGPETAIRLAAQMAFLLGVPFLLLGRTDWTRDIAANLLMAMALGGAAILVLDVASGYALSVLADPPGSGDGSLNHRQGEAEMTVGRALVVYAVLSPLLLSLYATCLPRRWAVLASVAFLALLLLGTVLNRLAITPLIVLGAAPLFLLGLRSARWGLRLSLGTLVLSVLFAPLVGLAARLMGTGATAYLPMSWDHRRRMWDYALSRISERPLTGYGLDISRVMDDAYTTRIGVEVPIISLHPHNVGLQTWMEAGAVGAVLLSLALVTLYRPLRRLSGDDPWRGAALSGLLMAAAIGGAVTVGAWQYWWWGMIALGAMWVAFIPLSSDRTDALDPDASGTDARGTEMGRDELSDMSRPK